MRTKILKYFGMVVVLIIMVNLTSCEVFTVLFPSFLPGPAA